MPFRDLKLKSRNDINKRYTRKLASATSTRKEKLTTLEEIPLFLKEMKQAMAELDKYFEAEPLNEPKKIEQI